MGTARGISLLAGKQQKHTKPPTKGFQHRTQLLRVRSQASVGLKSPAYFQAMPELTSFTLFGINLDVPFYP